MGDPPAPRGAAPRPIRAAGSGQFERFSPSRLSDRNGFVKETLAGTGTIGGNAPRAVAFSSTGAERISPRALLQYSAGARGSVLQKPVVVPAPSPKRICAAQ